MLTIGNEYTRNDIHKKLGGSKRAYLPTVSGVVVAICLKPDLNPRAPYAILCGDGPIIKSAGAALAKQQNPLPVFIKNAPNRWEYKGMRQVSSAHTCGHLFDALVANTGRNPEKISRVIELA